MLLIKKTVVTEITNYNLIEQPYGGYFRKHQTYNFENTEYMDPADETIHGTVMGNLVDILTRYLTFKDLSWEECLTDVFIGKEIFEKEFKRRKKGIAKLNETFDKFNSLERTLSRELIDVMTLFTFLSDLYRSGQFESIYPKFMEFEHLPEKDYQHVVIMFERSHHLINLLKNHCSQMYTDFKVAYDESYCIWGNGDFITNDMIVDFKCYKHNPYNKKNITQQVIYYLLGKNGISNVDIDFNKIKYLSLFDIRRNRLEFINVKDYQKELKYIQNGLDKIAFENKNWEEL